MSERFDLLIKIKKINILIMIKILYLVVLLLFFLAITMNYKNEKFIGYGNVYGVHSNPNPDCRLNNDCFPGYYA